MSNIPYILGIPAANNNPSEDQPNMQQNNDKIDAYVQVDHIGFNEAKSGMHYQVQFPNDFLTPAAAGVPPVLFVQTISGGTDPSLQQLFWFSGPNESYTTNQYSSLTNQFSNVSTYLFAGLIIKSGKFSIVSPTDPTTAMITYSALTPALSPFPNHTISVFISPADALSKIKTYYIDNLLPTSFSVNISSTPGTSTFYFLAIGN